MPVPRTVPVLPGDTWAGLASRYGVNADDLRRWNESGPDAPPPAGRQIRLPSHYLFQEGDRLESLAETYQVDFVKLARINGLASAHRLVPGFDLLVPAMDWDAATLAPAPPAGEHRHVVAYNDSLPSIANLYGTTPHAIAQLNGLPNEMSVYVGQELRIPSGG